MIVKNSLPILALLWNRYNKVVDFVYIYDFTMVFFDCEISTNCKLCKEKITKSIIWGSKSS
jgi:hypothetical protein